MAWKLLPTDYTDAVWSGLKRYTQVDNSDGTVSFNDVTTYTNKEKSFFGAKDANRMNEALNYIMSMLENGTNLYEEFQTYFTTQKELFKSSGDSSYQELTQYFVNLKAQGDSSLAQIEKTYEEHMEKNTAFAEWFIADERKVIVDCLRNITEEVYVANSIYPTYREELIERRVHQDRAVGQCYRLTQELQYAIETLPVDVNKYLRFAEMIQTEINLLKGWRKSDNKFKSALQEGNL